jgi:GR25 family glycosyltransferase involved in LPS biosynthesis
MSAVEQTTAPSSVEQTTAPASVEQTTYKYEDYIDGIMYINLADREDRKKSIMNEFEKAEIPSYLIHRIDATLTKVCGYLGCVDSHIKALEYAKEMKWQRFIIFEDDAILKYPRERILYIISEFLKIYENNWSVFMLYTCWTEQRDTDVNFINKLIWGTTTTGYMVNSSYLDTLLDNYKEGMKILYEEVEKWKLSNPGKKLYETRYALDQYCRKIQTADNWYVSNPYLCKPSPNLYSSIMSK